MVLYAGHEWVDDDPTKPLSAQRVGEIDDAVVDAHTEIATLQRRVVDAQPLTYAATVTPDAATGSVFSIVATGPLTLPDPSNGVDGQHVTVVVQASGATRTLTLSDATTVAIPAGEWWAGRWLYLDAVAGWLFTEGV